MSDWLMLRAPSTNRVYSQQAGRLAAAELALLCPEASDVAETRVAGVDHVRFTAATVPPALGAHSALLALYAAVPHEHGPLLRPVEVARPDRFDDDFVGIPKYPGKTNEQFTRLMVNLTLAAVRRPPAPRRVLDPMCGRGTTLTTALTLGHDAVGVEIEEAALDATAAYLRTYLRRGRLKHRAELTPVRREGRKVGRRLDVSVTPPHGRDGEERRSLALLTGDGSRSDEVCGRRGFDAIVLDAPYGVVHGSRAGSAAGGRDRSPAALLAEALPVWAGQLYAGGALGIAWNVRGLARADLLAMVRDAGLEPADHGPWLDLAHRVDSSIQRDLVVGVRPG